MVPYRDGGCDTMDTVWGIHTSVPRGEHNYGRSCHCDTRTW